MPAHWSAGGGIPSGPCRPRPRASAAFSSRTNALRRKLRLLAVNDRGQLVVRQFLQATREPVWGLRVVRDRYLFFAQ